MKEKKSSGVHFWSVANISASGPRLGSDDFVHGLNQRPVEGGAKRHWQREVGRFRSSSEQHLVMPRHWNVKPGSIHNKRLQR